MPSRPLARRLVSLTCAVAVAGGLLALSAPAAHAASPFNDNFASAAALPVLPSGSSQMYGTTAEATTESGEPSHHPDGVTPTSASIWYSYTPTSDGNFYVGVSGTGGYDPVLAVYTGTSVSTLTRVSANDDAAPNQVRSQISSLPVSAGTTYYIAVAGKSGGQSATQLTYSQRSAPWNDSVGNPDTLFANWSTVSWNVHASAQAGEPDIVPSDAATSTVWWRFLPQHNGTLSLSTAGSSFDTLLAIFRQDSSPFTMPGLTRLASNDDANPGTSTSAISGVSVKAGKSYWIAVDGFSAAQGRVVLADTWTPSAQPDNDDFADATPLSATYTLTGSNATATVEPGEPQHLSGGASGKSVWFAYKPAVDQLASINLGSTDFDAVVALYRGSSLASLVKVAEDRGAAKNPARLTQLNNLVLLAGQQYYFAIAGAGDASGAVGGSFRAFDRPVLSSLSPDRGPLAGGNWIDIRGAHLSGEATAVQFGSKAAAAVKADDNGDSVLHVQVPKGLPAGPVSVKVTTDGGPADNAPMYIVGQPAVGGLSQRYAAIGGGQKVQLTGQDFAGIPLVIVGGVPAAAVTVLSPTALTFVTPKHAKGVVTVSVKTISGTASTMGQLTYIDRPTVTRLSRKSGSHRGGFRITVSGRNFIAVSAVKLGAKTAKFALKGGKLTVTAPKGPKKKTVYLVVTTPGGTSTKVKAAKFRYR